LTLRNVLLGSLFRDIHIPHLRVVWRVERAKFDEHLNQKITRHRRLIKQRGHEHTRTGNCSESGFESLRGAP